MRCPSARRCAVLVALSACGGAAPSAPEPETGPPDDGPSIVVTPELGSPHVGEVAPDFELTDQGGAPLKLSSLRGSVVMLALVASWCPYSTAEQPHLAQLAQEYAPKGVRTVAVVVADTEAGAKKYLDRVAMPFPVLRDAKDEVALAYDPENALPSFKDRRKVVVTANLVLDRDGRIRFFTLADTTHFDATLVHARRSLDDLLATPGPS